VDANPNKTEEFDITIFGQPVIDHVITLRKPFSYGDLTKVCQVNPHGDLVFKENCWIGTIENEETYFFGMPVKYPNGEESFTLFHGKKASVSRLEKGGVLAPPALVARHLRPTPNIGGGGPNVLQILNQVFGKLSIEFIGAYSPMPGGEDIDPSIRLFFETVPPLLQEISPRPQRNLEIARIYSTVPVNIVIEGMPGNGEDRGVLKSPFAEKIIDQPFNPKGRAIMVNTVYSKTLAVNALCCAIENRVLGVLALTDSLCNNQDPFSNEEKEWIKTFLASRNMDIDLNRINTLYEFILKIILPQGPAVLIMNESELEHILNPKNEISEKLANLPKGVQFLGDLKEKIHYDISKKALIFKGGMSKEEKGELLGLSKDISYRGAIKALFQRASLHPVTGQKRVQIVERGFIHLDSLLKGLRAIRQLQREGRSKIYVTLGMDGSLCLDEKDNVHYSPVTIVEGLPNKGKNAIGDTYAAVVLAAEYINRFHKEVTTPYIISTAAAAADALFYSGFDNVSPATIDEFVSKTVSNYRDEAEKGNYHDLGPLSQLQKEIKTLPLPGAPHVRLGDIKRKDWFTVINKDAATMTGHYSMTDKYSAQFLTLHFANGTIG
jgi:hypothetical protein